jgi:hypothetical protein
MSGGTPGPLRLLSSALGGQVGWLLGFVLVTCAAMLVSSRLRRSDTRSGWLIAVGGAFLVTAALFSFAGGIFHPYYVSLLAPFIAALAGAGVAGLVGGGLNARTVGPLAVIAGVVTELVIRSRYPGQLVWLTPLLVVAGALGVVALLVLRSPRMRLLAVCSMAAVLLLAPAVWAVETLGHATNGTFPSGGPASVASGPGGGPLGRLGAPPGRRAGPAGVAGFIGPGGPAPFGGPSTGAQAGAPAQLPAGATPFSARRSGAPAFAGRPGGFGGPFGDDRSIAGVLSYVARHGGGTIAVSSQSSAAAAIIDKHASVAGIGGFSGRESDVSVSWLAQEVRSGRIRWVLAESTAGRARLPGDTRVGAKPAISAVTRACRAVALPATTTASGAAPASGKLYDCRGRASALKSAGTTRG